nr:U3 small nucleolar RNA-associated protein 4 [Polyrhizophydium stewartii]
MAAETVEGAADASTPAQDFTPVHRCRFVQHTPSAIVAMAYGPVLPTPADQQGQPSAAVAAAVKRMRLLAVARANGDIELWNPRGKAWFLERTIPGSPDSPIESVAWVLQPAASASSSGEDGNDSDSDAEAGMQEKAQAPSAAAPALPTPRLFAAGLSGHIVEYNLATMQPRNSTDSFGGPIWCMAANHAQTHIAVGCEDGFIRIFRIPPADDSDSPLEFVSTVEKQAGRVMSLAWHPSDKFIVAGSVKNTIRKISVATGKTIHRMSLDTVRGEDTIVWDLRVLPPPPAVPASGTPQLSTASETIVAADSLGYVTFWDWNTATLRKRVKAHGADALCLAANAAGTRVFSSGVDRKVVEITLADVTGPAAATATPAAAFGSKDGLDGPASNHAAGKRAPVSKMSWILSGQKRYHSHDVRALIYIEDRPFDALVSGGVDASLIFSTPTAAFARMKQQRMPTYPHRPIVSVASSARLVLARFEDTANVWRLGSVMQSDLLAPALLQDHQRLTHSAHKHLITIKFKGRTNLCASAISNDGQWIALSDLHTVKLYRVALNAESDQPSIKRVKHFPESSSGALALVFTSDGQRLVAAGVDGLRDGAAVSSLAVSHDGKWLASGDVLNRIHVFNLETHKLQATLPVFHSLHTSLSFHPTQPTLIVTCTSNEFYLYDVEAARLSDWSRANSHRLPTRFLERRETIMGACIDPAKPTRLVLWGASFMCTVDLAHTLQPAASAASAPTGAEKRSRSDSAPTQIKKRGSAMSLDASSASATTPAAQEGDDSDDAAAADETFEQRTTQARRTKSRSGRSQRVFRPRQALVLDSATSGDRKHHRNTAPPPALADFGFRMDHRFQAIMFIGFAGSDMIVVERPVLHVLAALPQAFYKHKYGT